MRRSALALILLGSAAYCGDPERVDTSLAIADLNGKLQQPFRTSAKASLLFFITNDCPISNAYAREIRRICEAYAGRVSCALDYTDPTLKLEDARKHFTEFGHGSYPAFIDVKHTLVKAAGADVTPEALLVTSDGKIAYRGRIDDKNVALGVARPKPTRADLIAAIDAVLAGKPVEVARTQAVGCFITPIEFFQKR